jgi:hypothetical protein
LWCVPDRVRAQEAASSGKGRTSVAPSASAAKA